MRSILERVAFVTQLWQPTCSHKVKFKNAKIELNTNKTKKGTENTSKTGIFRADLFTQRKNTNRKGCLKQKQCSGDQRSPLRANRINMLYGTSEPNKQPNCLHQKYKKTKKEHLNQKIEVFWWNIRDSNPGPTGYEPVALTNWANVPLAKTAAAISCSGFLWLLQLDLNQRHRG